MWISKLLWYKNLKPRAIRFVGHKRYILNASKLCLVYMSAHRFIEYFNNIRFNGRLVAWRESTREPKEEIGRLYPNVEFGIPNERPDEFKIRLELHRLFVRHSLSIIPTKLLVNSNAYNFHRHSTLKTHIDHPCRDSQVESDFITDADLISKIIGTGCHFNRRPVKPFSRSDNWKASGINALRISGKFIFGRQNLWVIVTHWHVKNWTNCSTTYIGSNAYI